MARLLAAPAARRRRIAMKTGARWQICTVPGYQSPGCRLRCVCVFVSVRMCVCLRVCVCVCSIKVFIEICQLASSFHGMTLRSQAAN